MHVVCQHLLSTSWWSTPFRRWFPPWPLEGSEVLAYLCIFLYKCVLIHFQCALSIDMVLWVCYQVRCAVVVLLCSTCCRNIWDGHAVRHLCSRPQEKLVSPCSAHFGICTHSCPSACFHRHDSACLALPGGSLCMLLLCV